MDDAIQGTFKVVVLGEGKLFTCWNKQLPICSLDLLSILSFAFLHIHVSYPLFFWCIARVGKTSITVRFCVNKFSDS